MIVDYTGKLNNHEDYLNILNKLYCKCDYIEIVIINGKSKNELVLKFEKDIIDTKKVSEWWVPKQIEIITYIELSLVKNYLLI